MNNENCGIHFRMQLVYRANVINYDYKSVSVSLINSSLHLLAVFLPFVAFHRIYMFVCFSLLPLVGE